MGEKIKCDHGYVLMQDSCPGCDAAWRTRHTATPVRVMGFKGRAVMRCTACSLPKGHEVHQPERPPRKRRRAVNTAAQGRDLELAVMAYLNAQGWTCMRSAGSRGVVDVVALPGNWVRPWLLVQCKLTDPVIPPAERLALTTLAVPTGALPLVAYRADPGKGTRVEYRKDAAMWLSFRELTGPGPKEWREWAPTTYEEEQNDG